MLVRYVLGKEYDKVMSGMSVDNKRIAKNTLYLYFRMFISLILGLFTARVTINALGVSDYGLFNVVGGVMGFIGYFSTLLSSGTSRYLTVGLGKGDMQKLKRIFSACGTLHLGMAIATLIIGETIGLWFVNYKLVIPQERMFAANYIYQLSLFGAFLGVTQSPYMASVIAHEKMSTFAFMSIFDVAFKLIIVCLLLYVDTDKLMMLSTFYMVTGLLTFIMYRIYCLRKFEECSMRLVWDKKLSKDIWNYVGWNSIGSFAYMANNQGITVILNLFFSTIVNAARGIAATVSTNIYNFVFNFQTAVRPQITKLFAVGEFKEMNKLICNSAKYSSYLLIIIGLPVFIETEYLITLWLGHVPTYVIAFIRITLVEMLLKSIDLPIGDGIQAVGKMKLPNITSAIAYFAVLPTIYIALSLGASPVMAYIITCMSYPLALVCDLWILRKYTGFDIPFYCRDILARLLIIIIISAVLPTVITFYMPFGFLRFALSVSICVLCSCIVIFYYGLNKEMRYKVVRKVKNKLAFAFHQNT